MTTKTIDQQFVEYAVQSLVGNPSAVQVERTIDEKGVLLTLTVDPEDLGRVIGKRGATAQSLRTLLRALGTKNEARYNLKIVDNGVPREDRQERSQQSGSWGADDVAQDTQTPAPASSSSSDDDFDFSQETPKVTEDRSSEDSLSKTRKELADLDDLDI